VTYIKEKKAEGFVVLRGQSNQPAMLDMIGKSHVLISPTTSDFSEGLAKVPLEGVIAGRPVIVSSSVPAKELLGDAAQEIPADNQTLLVDAVRQLVVDPEKYRLQQAACEQVKAQFFDRSRSWGTLMLDALIKIAQRRSDW
jgi:glycosyltransferase involved in cell wall biosynthesis